MRKISRKGVSPNPNTEVSLEKMMDEYFRKKSKTASDGFRVDRSRDLFIVTFSRFGRATIWQSDDLKEVIDYCTDRFTKIILTSEVRIEEKKMMIELIKLGLSSNQRNKIDELMSLFNTVAKQSARVIQEIRGLIVDVIATACEHAPQHYRSCTMITSAMMIVRIISRTRMNSIYQDFPPVIKSQATDRPARRGMVCRSGELP